MRLVLPLLLMLLVCARPTRAYDPLDVPRSDDREGVAPLDLDVVDRDRGRTVPIRVFLPADGAAVAPRPVILFSHGLGGTRSGSGYLGEHWSRRGYVAVFLQHPGSDASVWQDEPVGRRMAAMREAASPANLRLRTQDVPSVLDALAAWNATAGHDLAGRFDLDRVGMAGHSFGAQTTQAVSGQKLPLVGRRFTDPRIKAAAVMSPGSPRGRADAGTAFEAVEIPWLVMTGTRDTAAIGGQTVESRLAVFAGLPEGRAYELVLHDAEHSAFTDRPLPGDRVDRNPNHHRSILAITTAFWDAFLRDDPEARRWLDGDGPRSVLDPDDRWRRK